MALGLGWIPGVSLAPLWRGHSPASRRHWPVGALCWTPALTGSPPRYNEINAISTACSYGVTECQELAIEYLQQWQNSTTNP